MRKFMFTCSIVVVCSMLALATHARAENANAPVPNIGGLEQPGGIIKGVAKFDGKTRRGKPIAMQADRVCTEYYKSGKEAAVEEKFVFGENNTLQNVFVYVSKGLEGKKFDPPKSAKVLDQAGCVYHPHVMGVIAGVPFNIHNSDPTLHNVDAQARINAKFNEGMPVKDMVLTKTLDKPEMAIQFKCQVHPWMMAYVHVIEHPFFATTQGDGTFEIHGLPPGEYEITFWHEFESFKADKQTMTVTVEQDKTTEVEVTYAPPKKD